MRATPTHPFLDHRRPLAIAHRGGGLEAEENTLPAFMRAVGLGFTHVELDVHASADGQVVVHHDDTLQRMFDDPRKLGALPWAELQGLRTRGDAGLPLMAEVLESFPGLNVAIEAKSDEVVAPLADLLARMKVLDRVCVGAFAPSRTRRLRAALGPGLCWSPAHAGVARLWLAGWGLPVLAAGRFPVVQVPTHFKGLAVVTPRMLRAAHGRGIQVQVWTVDAETEMERLLDMGVDAIMTDRPTLLREVMRRRGLWRGA